MKLEAILVEQLALLSDACTLFDQGRIVQVKAISTRLYSICHDIMRQADWKYWCRNKSIIFTSTAHPPTAGKLNKAHHPLVSIAIGSDGTAFCALGSGTWKGTQLLKFSKWWEESVLHDANHKLSRKNIVFQMRNHDGGSHGFSNVSSLDYQAIRSDRGLGWTALAGDEPVAFETSALEATTRQIAHELLISLVPCLSPEQQKEIGYQIDWKPSQFKMNAASHADDKEMTLLAVEIVPVSS